MKTDRSEHKIIRRLKMLRANLGGRILLLIISTFLIMFTLVSVLLYIVQHRAAQQSISVERRSLCAEASDVVGNACAYLRGIVDYFSTEPKIESMLLRDNTAAEERAQ